jgi:hypothetical protein
MPIMIISEPMAGRIQESHERGRPENGETRTSRPRMMRKLSRFIILEV